MWLGCLVVCVGLVVVVDGVCGDVDLVLVVDGDY